MPELEAPVAAPEAAVEAPATQGQPKPQSFGIFESEEPAPQAAPETAAPSVDAKKAEFEERAKLERSLRERELELKTAREKLSEYDTIRTKRPKDILKHLGLDAMDVAQDLLQTEPEEQPRSEVETLKEQIQSMQAYLQQAETQRLETQQTGYINTIIDEKETPYLNYFRERGEDVAKQVLQVAIRRVQESKGQTLPEYKDIVAEAEKYVREKYEPLTKRFSSAPQPAAPQKAQKPATRTISENMTREPTPTNTRDMTDLDRQERFKQLMREEGWGEDKY